MADILVDLVFGSAYGLVVTGIAAVVAIPYSIWRACGWAWTRVARRGTWRRESR